MMKQGKHRELIIITLFGSNNRTTSISNAQNEKLRFAWLAKKDNLMLLNRCKVFRINLNAQLVNGMTHFDC